MKEEKVVFDINKVMEILPHRPPFLLVDKVIEFVENERIVSVKNVTMNEPYFVGHFPGQPVMPGVMILEAMAQTGAILAATSTEGPGEGKILYLVGANNIKWKKMVVPGDALRIETVFQKRKGPFWFIAGKAFVAGEMVAEAEIMAMAS